MAICRPPLLSTLNNTSIVNVNEEAAAPLGTTARFSVKAERYVKPKETTRLQAEQLRQFVIDKAEDMKARDIEVLDVKGKTDVADFMVICSGNSKTHVRSIAEHVATEAKHAGLPPLGIEGGEQSEWVLVDLGDVVLHVMQESIRDFYQLENSGASKCRFNCWR